VGARLVELLKQPQYQPMGVEQETMVVYAGTQGYLDDVPVSRVLEFQNQFLAYVDSSAADVRSLLADKKELSADIEAKLKTALTDFKAKAWKK
jgi:F-type H+-transporting ATPase subunit alpha